MHCWDCRNWICARLRQYGDGSRLTDYKASPGKGFCELLNMETASLFGCLSFIAGDHVRVEMIEGAPWENWTMIPCPDCGGRGCTDTGRACGRCSGTSKVRRYDDGYVADATWDHPKEKERKGQVVPLPEPALQPVKRREGVMS